MAKTKEEKQAARQERRRTKQNKRRKFTRKAGAKGTRSLNQQLRSRGK